MILVTGATGNIGSQVLARLPEFGTPVRAQIHDLAKVDAVPDGTEVVQCSFEDESAWDAAVSGCSAVLLISPAGPHQRRHENAVIEAVLRSGTGAHVVKVASMGLDDSEGGRIAKQHAAIRDDLVASRLPWSVLSVSQLMNNLRFYLAAARRTGLLLVPAGDARIPWVAARDVAEVALAILASPGQSGRTFDVTGPESLHHDDVAGILSRHFGRSVTYVDASPEDAIDAMTATGLDPWVARGIVETNSWFATRAAAGPSDTVRTLTGHNPRTLASFVAALPEDGRPQGKEDR